MNRLQTLLSCIRECEILADIGTDHAYLPIEAIRGGLCKKAIACDIVEGPLKIAKKISKPQGLKKKLKRALATACSRSKKMKPIAS
jgi:tRNA (adenine22-N1)-methyltransferase